MKTNPNDAAFSHATDPHGNPTVGFGLTKREYFAAMALPAVYSISRVEAVIRRVKDCCEKEGIAVEQFYAEAAVETADAMITALNKEAK